MNLIRLADLGADDVRQIWSLAAVPSEPLGGHVAWSFEGNGIRTRTTFMQAFRELGLVPIELPNFLKTTERVVDLAGYMDPFYDLYVIRESNHERLAAFAEASSRPVINAMSGEVHPCEVLADACHVEATQGPIAQARICLWGPPTNVLRSWHELARVLGLDVRHVCAAGFHEDLPNVRFSETGQGAVDIVITDGWPPGCESAATPLTLAHLAGLGRPRLLPTPPFTVGRELAFDPCTYEGFVGYRQKQLLLPVQKAILRHALKRAAARP
jgi:ornithine carbamoyltransferase